ncbi:uncharacterized protein LOC108411816 isoform X2 [Pygocentrus nattereri]|uniref:uncharacterized protein LOC108411816 isoform X2 n=1 Tax=Pygocentrus nattereri TaxID=42514 RepID=UPI0008149870|nr:uncharacterized protein LOC108411816 isoform X2 [Pygocentrus nattereri]XP_017539055.1 uncharacterized protein LOC108411816 isoform X2 [Pygocentrus nattereri]
MIRLMCKTGATFIQKKHWPVGSKSRARVVQQNIRCSSPGQPAGRQYLYRSVKYARKAIFSMGTLSHRMSQTPAIQQESSEWSISNQTPYSFQDTRQGQHVLPHDKSNVRYTFMHLHHNNGKQGGTCPIRIHGHLRIQDKARMFLLIQMVQVEEEMNVFPLNSVETLEDLEKRLLNNGLKQRMTNTLSLSGGHTMKKTIWRIASKVFTTNLAKSLNWCGRGHKRGLKQTACGQLIIAAAGKNPTLPAPTEAEAEKCLKDYLRLAPARR